MLVCKLPTNNIFVYRLLVLSIFSSLATAAVLPNETQATIVKYENTNDGIGNYKFRFETSNGIIHEEIGRLVNAGTENEHIAVEGSYSYIDVKDRLVIVNYKSDQNGYQVLPPVSVPQSSTGFALPASVVATLLGK